jgi:hypothetical protein
MVALSHLCLVCPGWRHRRACSTERPIRLPLIRAPASRMCSSASRIVRVRLPPIQFASGSKSNTHTFLEPPFVITALGLFNETNSSMPVDSINYERSWKTSQILPFLANVGLERLSCNATATGTGANATGGNTSGSESTFFIRTLVNSATIPIPGCASGPSGSCPLNNFTSFISGESSSSSYL